LLEHKRRVVANVGPALVEQFSGLVELAGPAGDTSHEEPHLQARRAELPAGGQVADGLGVVPAGDGHTGRPQVVVKPQISPTGAKGRDQNQAGGDEPQGTPRPPTDGAKK
jgi:hypothetical protein